MTTESGTVRSVDPFRVELPLAPRAVHTRCVDEGDEITVNGRRVLLRAAVARRVHVEPDTWHAYVSRQQPKGNPAPKPDGHIDGRTPYWWPETVDAWHARRPVASQQVEGSDAR